MQDTNICKAQYMQYAKYIQGKIYVMHKYNYARQKYIFKAKIICKPQNVFKVYDYVQKKIHVHFACHNYMQAIVLKFKTKILFKP